MDNHLKKIKAEGQSYIISPALLSHRGDFRLFYSDEFIRHVQWPGHLESPDRLMAIEEKRKGHNLWNPISPEEGGEAVGIQKEFWKID